VRLFLALAIDISFGEGQKVSSFAYRALPYIITTTPQVPGNLVNNAINAAILHLLLSHVAFIRIAGFATGRFLLAKPGLFVILMLPKNIPET
jgi:hypothetical protein